MLPVFFVWMANKYSLNTVTQFKARLSSPHPHNAFLTVFNIPPLFISPRTYRCICRCGVCQDQWSPVGPVLHFVSSLLYYLTRVMTLMVKK